MSCKLAVPTASLGRCSAGHLLETKLDAAKTYGYQGIELCFEDLLAVAGQGDTGTAAQEIKAMCKKRDLHIVCLQAFVEDEGALNRIEIQSKLRELAVWIQLARILGTDMIMIPASDLPDEDMTRDIDMIVDDLRRAAEEGLREKPHIKIAYESRCSSTRIDKWEFCWDVIKKVGKDNFGMCLDIVHIAGRLFADPAAPSGLVPDGIKAVELSMHRFVKRMKAHREKIFYVQFGNARRPDEPIVPGSSDYDANERPRTIWSHNYRLFYGEEARGAYLPMKDIAEAVFNCVHFEGWVSAELFNRRMDCEDLNVPNDLARRGAIAWRKLGNDMGWWPTLPIPATDAIC
ncbi:xylose isomerase-like protein [Lojkania enalia]|uniref:Xylose isomerase-like protein n=1 Tax=Lojkania enalia TaxID=147567 RepID=A0A9P4MYH4_9PLEO|nr:xylose isomerase-like protein [Didymosphaeria enalia]